MLAKLIFSTEICCLSSSPVASLRMKLPADILQIREQIITASDVELDGIIFPDYAALPWE